MSFRALAARAAPRLALLLVASVLAAQGAPGTEDGGLFAVSGSLEWAAYRFDAAITLDVAAAGLRLPSGRARAEGMVRDEAPRLLRQALLSLRIDSSRTLAQALASGDVGIEDIDSILNSPRPSRSSFSEDFRSFRAEYSIPVLGILSLFVRHSGAQAPAAVLDYRPTKDYTGIIVYVPDGLPVHGELAKGDFRPSLFPRIWDERMDLVLERNMVDPGVARTAGMVAYRAEGSGGFIEDRVGGEPLRIMAIGLFGDGRTDIVISREDALRIAANAANRRLIEKGRVLVMVGDTLERP